MLEVPGAPGAGAGIEVVVGEMVDFVVLGKRLAAAGAVVPGAVVPRVVVAVEAPPNPPNPPPKPLKRDGFEAAEDVFAVLNKLGVETGAVEARVLEGPEVLEPLAPAQAPAPALKRELGAARFDDA